MAHPDAPFRISHRRGWMFEESSIDRYGSCIAVVQQFPNSDTSDQKLGLFVPSAVLSASTYFRSCHGPGVPSCFYLSGAHVRERESEREREKGTRCASTNLDCDRCRVLKVPGPENLQHERCSYHPATVHKPANLKALQDPLPDTHVIRHQYSSHCGLPGGYGNTTT